MDTTEFWHLIDKTRAAANGNVHRESELLTEELAKLPPEEIISFERIFDDLKDKAYVGNLWDAATVIMKGCGDDGFQEFREWLVGRGKEAYENAIKDPETLVNVLEIGDQIFPTLLSPAMEAYEKVTRKNMPPMPRPGAQLQGRHTINIDEEETELLAEISTRFPKLTAHFWEWWTRDKVYVEVREILREILLPLDFKEKESKWLGRISFKREPLLVEWVFDYDYDIPDYTLYVSSEERERKLPVAILMQFLPNEYSEEIGGAVCTSIQQWLEIVGA